MISTPLEIVNAASVAVVVVVVEGVETAGEVDEEMIGGILIAE